MREPNDPHTIEYDYDLKEHTVLVSDWMHDYGEMYTPGLVNTPGGISPTSVIINGKGQYRRNVSERVDVLFVQINSSF